MREAFDSRAEELLAAGPAGSGKTAALLLKLYWVCRKYAGARCLIVRKTRESLSESVLVTWERDILGPTHPILTTRPNLRKVRQCYQFPNGSTINVGGLDKPDKTLSSEYDLIYIAEATDLKKEDWETLGRALRSGKVPYQQIIACCNPTTPQHWLYQRCQAGLCKLVSTTHKDNPRFWDREKGDWTDDGRTYLKRLERMTGARRNRFLLGLWKQAEGLVYNFLAEPDAETGHPGHLLPHDWQPPANYRRVWSIDWGRTSPTVLQLWAFDDESRMYLYREVYQTHLRPDELGRWARQELDAGREPYPDAVVCDHDDRCKSEFERTSGLSLSLADKVDRKKGIEEMQSRFDMQEDGRPRIFFHPNGRETVRGRDADPSLTEHGLPTSTVEELVGYVWDTTRTQDEPIDYNDHGADAGRYACRYVSANTGNVAYPIPKTSISEQMNQWRR